MRSRSVTRALLLLAGLAVFPAVAFAHQRLLGTSPSRDSTADTVPRELRLVFYEPVELAFTTIRLTGPDGRAVALGELRTASDSATVLVVPITGELAAGGYSVQWATASRDGHPVQGEFGFAIAENATGLETHAADHGGDHGATVTAPGQQAPPAEHHAPAAGPGSFQADAPAYVLVRWANYLGLLGVIGTVVFRFFVLGYLRRRWRGATPDWAREAAGRAASLGVLFAVFTLVAGVARLYAQSLALHGAGLALDGERLLMLLRRTVWGWGWLIQMGTASLALVGFGLARRSPDDGPAPWTLAALAALGLAVTPALSGHAAAMTGTAGTLAIVTHTLHVLAAAGWLGSLFVLLLAGLPAAMGADRELRGESIAELVRAFSPTALLFAALLVASGVAAAFLHSSSLDALIGSRYGNLLFVKIAIVLVVFGTGAYNFLRVQPALGSGTTPRHLQRSAGVELAVAAVVLMVTAVLVATARPYEEEERFSAEGAAVTSVDERSAEPRAEHGPAHTRPEVMDQEG